MELASEKEMGLGLASKGTPMWLLLLLDVGGGMAAPGSGGEYTVRSIVGVETAKAGEWTRSPLAAAERSMATRSVSPYLPSKYRIMVVSSIALL